MSSTSFRPLCGCILASGVVLLSGCGLGSGSVGAPTNVGAGTLNLSGAVHGGQQPVVGAAIQLYAAGKNGLGSASRAMLTAPVLSDAAGGFSISGLYTCQAGDQVYLVASGGNAGGGANSDIKMMTALGPCATLQANAAGTFVTVNEVTTVASVFALDSVGVGAANPICMTGVANVGADYTSTAQTNALAAAFATVPTMVNTSTGFALVTSTGNGQVPVATINSLANSIAACVNSGTSGGSANSCSNLFSAAPSGGTNPTDTLQAVVNIAASAPTANSAAIFALASAAPPFQPTLASAPANYVIAVAHPSDVLTYHNDNTRQGVQNAETVLTPASVSSATFGKKFTFPVDSYLFAQPLYVGGLGMPDGAVHNVVFAATTHATVYAFDADGNNPAAGSLWTQSYVPAGERYAAAADYGGCSNPPEAGIVGTPVINRATQTMYFVTKTVAATGTITAANTYQRLHAVSLVDGSERPGSPMLINPTFAGSGDGSAGGSVPFNAQRQSVRSALTLANSPAGLTVYVNYASHCDFGPYHGDILGFNAANVSQVTSTFNNTPNGNDGGIWMSNGGMAVDASGHLYALAGNGTFDANTGGPDYGDAATKLTPPAAGATNLSLTVTDYFTPSNQADLQSRDLDLGGAEGILFTDSGSGAQLLVGSDKNGYIYLLNTANMGRYQTGTHGINGQNGDVQDFNGQGTIIYNSAFFNNTLYASTPVESFAFQPGSASTPGTFNLTAIANKGFTGAPVVSANGTANAVVWVEDGSAVLHALTAPGLTEIYNSSQAGANRDAAAPFVKFTSPVVANGKVYLSGSGAIVVYGLLP